MRTLKRVALTAGELRWEAALSELLPAVPTIWNFNVTGKFQNSNTQTKGQYLTIFRYYFYLDQ